MASDELDIPQIAVVGVPDDNNTSPAVSSGDSSRLPHSPSTTDDYAYLSPITPILPSARSSQDPLGSTSDNPSIPPPPSPTLSAQSSGSVRWVNSTALRDNNPEEHDGLSSLHLAPPSRSYRRKGSTGTVSSIASSSTTEQDADDSSSSRLSPLRPPHSDVTSSPTYAHVDTTSDVDSRSSSVTSFFKSTIHRVRRSSPSPGRETDAGSNMTQSDGQRKDSKGAELARPVMLDLKQEADLDVHPFLFKPLQLASLVDPKSLEVLESMGGVNTLLRGLGTHPTLGLSTESGSPPAHFPSSPGPAHQDFTVSRTTDKDKGPLRPDIMITSPAGEPRGLQSTTSLGGDVSAEFQCSEEAYRTSIEDRQRIFGQNVLPRRPIKSLLQLMWLALKDKVLVSSN